MKKRIIVSGLLNVETTVAVKEFPIPYYQIDYPFFGINSNVSGVGCNNAKALTMLGDEVELISFLGSDPEGKRVLEDLEQYGIRTDGIEISLKNTPASVVLFDPAGKRQVYCDLKDIQDKILDPARWLEKLAGVDLAVMCNINFNRRLIRAAHEAGVLIATDVHVLSDINDEYNRDFMECSDILFLSDERLPCSPDEFADKLHELYNNRIIVIGMGEKGALLRDAQNEGSIRIPAFSKGKVVNTVGAGDALFSAFIHYYVRGYGAEDALKRAVIFAGIKIGYNGASIGFCSDKEVEDNL